jgi:hypothetical protein
MLLKRRQLWGEKRDLAIKKPRLPEETRFVTTKVVTSDFYYLAGLRAFRALCYREFDAIAFGQIPKAFRFDGRIMHKNIRPILRGDETI